MQEPVRPIQYSYLETDFYLPVEY